MGKFLLSIPTIRVGIPTIRAGAAFAKARRVAAQRGKHAAIRFWSGRKSILGIAFSALSAGTVSFAWPHWQPSAKVAPTRRVVAHRGKHAAIGFWSGRKWILRIAFSALIAATVSFAWAHWQPSTKVAPTQGVWASIDNSKYLFRLSSSKTIGSVLAPELVRAWLVSIRASEVEETDRVGRDGNQILESVISARLNGNPVLVGLKASGSSSAFNDMASGDADVGLTSREINSSELTRLMPLGDMRSAASEHVLGLEGIAVIVPHSNNISSLSRSTLKKIFTGQITNWSAVGIKRLPIHLYARDKNSRTTGKFASLVLGDGPMADAKLYEDSAKLESDVASDPGGIGFVTMPYVKDTRSVSISGERAAPLGRQLYLYTAAAPRNPAASDFVRFAVSPQGQNIVRHAGFAADVGEAPLSSDNAATIALLGDNLKVAISAERVEQNLPPPPAPPKFTPPSVAAGVPDLVIGPTKAPARPPTITASLQAPPPPPPAITASLQAPTPPVPQATPPIVTTAPLPASSGPAAASPVVEAVPPPPAPEHLAPPPVLNVAPPPAAPLPTLPVAINSHAVTAADYPRIAVQLQEQGTIPIKYLVREDGSVGDCAVTTSSGKPLLDAAACAIVKQRWKFKPGTQDGKPIAEFLSAEVVFKLADPPKEPRPTIMASLSPPPRATVAPVVTETPDPRLPIPLTNHGVTIDDYPVPSRVLQEQGNVLVKYLVKEDGSVGNCTVTTSSGKPRLDAAACAMVKRRWKFKPATQDGKPIAEFLTAEVVFKLK